MKKILLLFALTFSFFSNVSAQKEKLDQLFDKFQDTDGVTSIKISKPMFSMLNKLNIDDEDLKQIKPLLSKINGLRILIVEKPAPTPPPLPDVPPVPAPPAAIALNNLQKEIMASVKNLNYEELMSVNSKTSKVKFLSSNAKDGLLENLLLNINSDGNNVLMMLDGKISMDDVNKLINSTQENIDKLNFNTNTETSNVNSNSINRNVESFTGISVSSGINVTFEQGNNQSVKVNADSDKLQYVVTKVENGILKIYVDSKGVKNLRFRNLNVAVVSPKIEKIQTSAGSNFTALNTLNADNMDVSVTSGSNLSGNFNIKDKTLVEITSGSNMKMGIDSRSVDFKGTSGSTASITGNSKDAMFSLTSGSVCNAQNLKADHVVVETSSGASLTVNAAETLNAKASSGGIVRYKGNPKVMADVNKLSGGSVKSLN